MNNKKFVLYKRILESFKLIITQNNLFENEIKTITTDEEIALIIAIIEVFPNVKRFNCYFHYKKNLIDNLRKNGLLKKKNNEEKYKDIKKVIYLFGKIPLKYEGNMEKFFNFINDIKKTYSKFNKIYFIY